MATKNFAANLKIGATLGSSVGRVFGGMKSRIKDQESTLKQLRAAYRDASKGTGEYAGRLDELKAKLAAAERQMLRFRAAAKFDISKSLRGVGATFGKDLGRVGIASGVVGGVGLGVAKNMLDITATFEKALTVLKTVEGSGEKAKSSFSWIQGFAEKTPFELQQVLDAFVKLKAYGIDPIRGDTLRVLGDTASAMGKDVNDAVEAISDAVTGENERLKEFGIKAAKQGSAITYEYTTRAGKQMRKTVDASNREQIKSTILAIWNSKYKGAMDDQSKTWNGMVSNLKDTWAKFSYMVMTSGPFDILKGQLGSLLEKLGQWAQDGTMKNWAENTGRQMVETGKQISEVVTKILTATNAIKDFVGGWKNLGIVIIGLNFAPTILAIAGLTKGILTLAASLWGLSGASWAVVGPWALLGVAIAGLGLVIYSIVDPGGPLDILGRIFPETMEKIRQSVYSAVTWIGDQFDKLTSKITEFLSYLGQLTGIGGFFSSATPGMKSSYNPNQYDLPRQYYGSSPQFKPNTGAGPLSGITPPQQPATKEDLTSFIRNTTGNKTANYNINVVAPGGDGRRIADGIRDEFTRKPLFDMDGLPTSFAR